jgi:cephalosporin-C deacetylase-like acetyl esterase
MMRKQISLKITGLIFLLFFAIGALPVASMEISYDEIKAEYNYDHSKPLNIEIKDTKDFASYTKIHFFYDSLNGGRVPAILMLPKDKVKPLAPERATVPGAYPAVFFMHFHVSDKSLADIFSTWTGYGVAVMAIDGVFRGEREEEGKDILMDDPFESAKNIRMQIMDILRGFDVLADWKGIDPGRIGYMGVSMGAMTGAVATTLDQRIKVIDLADGGADYSLVFDNSDYGSLMRIKAYMVKNNLQKDEFLKVFVPIDPVTFVPHIGDRPVLLQNGKTDTTISVPAMNKLHELVPEANKKIIWYNSGHILPFDKLLYDSFKFFRKTL